MAHGARQADRRSMPSTPRRAPPSRRSPPRARPMSLPRPRRRRGPSRRWRLTRGADRAAYLRAIARGVEARRPELEALQMRNSGKPRGEAEIDVSDAIATFDYYAGLAEDLDARQGTDVPMPDRRLRRQDPVRAGRAGRHDRAVELPARHLRLEDRAGARRRLHGRAQDLGIHPADRARLRRHRGRRPGCPPGS